MLVTACNNDVCQRWREEGCARVRALAVPAVQGQRQGMAGIPGEDTRVFSIWALIYEFCKSCENGDILHF